MDTMLDAREASAFLGIKEEKLKEFVAQKVIPAYMIAGQYLRFKKKELETLKHMLKENCDFQDDERVFNKAFSQVRGFEKFKELLRANDIYLIIGIAIVLIICIRLLLKRF